nr:T9SS type A sorting domain-containing protein [candidate division Zixibacteria bacterium]
MKRILLFIWLSILLAPAIRADKFSGWESFTSTDQVRYVDYFEDSLQVITSGGWLKIDPFSGGMRKITNNDGLGTNNLYYILRDSDGIVWLAGQGRLIRIIDNQFKPYLFYDNENNLMTLYSIADDGDQLWIATSIGLVLFSKNIDDGQIEDFYYRFGDGISDKPSVFDIMILGDSIWLGTSDGIAYADKSNPDFLKSPDNWMVLKPSSYISSSLDTVTALALYNDNIYLGTTHDAFKLNRQPAFSLTDLPTRSIITVKHLIVTGDSLMIYAGGGFFAYSDTRPIIWNNTPAIVLNTHAAGRVVDGVHWVGNYLAGMYHGWESEYEHYDDGGLLDNQISALSVDSSGNVFAAFNSSGISVYDGTSWSSSDLGVVGSDIRDIMHDNRGGLWVGTWGGGLYYISDDTTIIFKEDNSSLHGVFDNYSYVVASHLAATSDYLFALNFAARDNNVIRVVDLGDFTRWGSFGFSDGITPETDNYYSLDCLEDRFVVGTADQGVFYYYFGNDPFDKSDDSVVYMNEDNSHLGSDEVKTIKFDNQGELWIGTKFGLSLYDPGIDRFDNVTLPSGFGPEVKELTFDRRRNVWIGAQNGLGRYNIGIESFDVYTINNSGLAADDIIDLVINPATNDLWIGTREGISKLESIIGPPTEVAADVIAFPNPFVIRGDGSFLSFNYDGNATVRIYTVNGELVREMDVNVLWDGTNQQQQPLASGVYLFLMTAENGSVGRGKILLVRN